MEPNDILANRLLHVLVLSVVALALIALSADLDTGYRIFVAMAPIVTWVLGKYYERAIILQADLVDGDTLRELEREKARIIFGS